MIPTMSNGHHVPPQDHPEERRTPTTAIAVVLASLISGTSGSVITYGVSHRPRPPCAAEAAPAKDDCTCPKCEAGQRCSPATCPTCVDLAVSRELRINALERQVQKIRQVSACGGDGNLLDSALR